MRERGCGIFSGEISAASPFHVFEVFAGWQNNTGIY
jgi:hypothetical protein